MKGLDTCEAATIRVEVSRSLPPTGFIAFPFDLRPGSAQISEVVAGT